MKKESLPDLAIERGADGLILLTQSAGIGEEATVSVHPVHIRHLAEQCGLVETSDPQAQKTIAMLTRRLTALRDRVMHLSSYILHCSDHRHADLTYEREFSLASADIAVEFCKDLADVDPIPEWVWCDPEDKPTSPAEITRKTASGSTGFPAPVEPLMCEEA